MKILSFQPFSLYGNGGGNRILRRLYQGRESAVISLAVEEVVQPKRKGLIEETIVRAEPATQWWMRWRLRNVAIWLRRKPLRFITINLIRKKAAGMAYDVIHTVNHGPYSAALCTDQFCSGKPLWVSFHDHFSTTFSSFDDAGLLWKKASRRLVIAEELGNEYQKLFGNLPYEIITDGVLDDEINLQPAKNESPLIIYFAGLLHLEYMPLFSVLATALDELSAQNFRFKLVLRGTQSLDFLNNRSFEVEYRPVTLSNAELKQELDAAAILYLPIKFTVPDFYLYSLSTKMVGYLGAPGTILYHGPLDSAACHLLTKTNAAFSCGSLNTDDLVATLKEVLNNGNLASRNAKALAQSRFSLANIQQHFWQC